jgi:hypothetical protein
MYKGESIIIRTVCFIFRKNKGRDLTTTQFFNIVPLRYNALCPSPHNLIYGLRIKSFGLRDKPRMHRYIQLVVRGKPTTSYGLFKWTEQVSLKVSRLYTGCSNTSKFSFLRFSTVWAVSASVMYVDWRPVPSPCLTLVWPFLNFSLH